MKKMGILFLTSFILLSCQPQQPSLKESKEDMIFGFSMDSFVVERWQRDRDIFQAKAKDLGASVIFQNANEDHETQVRQIQFLSEKNIKVLLVVPNDSVRLAPILRQVKAKGIRVISYDRLARGAGVDLYISFDNVAVGKLMAEHILKKDPQGNFIILNGAQPDYNSTMINQGIHQVLDTQIEGGFKILNEGWIKTWSSTEASDFFKENLKKYPLITGIIAANDMIAESAIKALSEKQRLKGVCVVGMDAELSACQRLAEGTQSMTVYKPIELLASTAADLAFALAKGEGLIGTELFQDGNDKIPYMKLQPIGVTAENLQQTVIKDGFHTYQAIYRR